MVTSFAKMVFFIAQLICCMCMCTYCCRRSQGTWVFLNLDDTTAPVTDEVNRSAPDRAPAQPIVIYIRDGPGPGAEGGGRYAHSVSPKLAPQMDVSDAPMTSLTAEQLPPSYSWHERATAPSRQNLADEPPKYAGYH